MRQFLRHLTLLCLVMALLPAAVALPAAAQTEVVADEELVIINRDDRIVVRDFFTPPGSLPLSWESPQTGFRQVATGDFNGDGTDEIVGLRGGQAVVYDPYRQANEPDVATTFPLVAPQTWSLVVTGKYFASRPDCIVLQQGASGNPGQLFSYCFLPPAGWTQVYTQVLGAGFRSLASGDVDGNLDDELIGIRNSGSFHQIIILNPSNNWLSMYEVSYDYSWVAVASGNTNNESPRKDEIVTTRSGVGTNLDSLLIFRWVGNNVFQDVAGAKFFPEFQKIALGDVNASGDEEVYLLRPGVYDGTPIVALTSRNYGSDSAIQFDELANQTRFGNIQAGDVDGDGKAEVIVMASNEYLIYTEPATSRTPQYFPGSYSTSLSFALGNLDGSGIPQGLTVTPATVNLPLQSGQTATQVVQVTNSGTGTLTWTATVTPGSSWLSVEPTGGTTPAPATLQIDARNLAAAAYTGTVRFSSQSGTTTTTQDVTVNLTVTTPPFFVTPTVVSWTYTPPENPGARTVRVTGTGLGWHAGVVPMDSMQRIEAAIAAGRLMAINNGFLVLGDGSEDVPIVDYIDVNPSSSTAVQIDVTLSLVLARVPYGLNQAAVVFVADGVASPPAVVVRASVLRTQPGASDLYFVPLIE